MPATAAHTSLCFRRRVSIALWKRRLEPDILGPLRGRRGSLCLRARSRPRRIRRPSAPRGRGPRARKPPGRGAARAERGSRARRRRRPERPESTAQSGHAEAARFGPRVAPAPPASTTLCFCFAFRVREREEGQPLLWCTAPLISTHIAGPFFVSFTGAKRLPPAPKTRHTEKGLLLQVTPPTREGGHSGFRASFWGSGGGGDGSHAAEPARPGLAVLNQRRRRERPRARVAEACPGGGPSGAPGRTRGRGAEGRL